MSPLRGEKSIFGPLRLTMPAWLACAKRSHAGIVSRRTLCCRAYYGQLSFYYAHLKRLYKSQCKYENVCF